MIWTSYVILLWTVAGEAVLYDPTGPYLIANQDPDLAYPQNAVTCTGSLPLFNHRIQPSPQDTGPITLQKLCAQTQYGGYPDNNNVGAYCHLGWHYVPENPPDQRAIQVWEFRIAEIQLKDTIPEESAYYRPSFDMRLAAYCQYRCTCTAGSPEQQAPDTLRVEDFRPSVRGRRAIVDLDDPDGYGVDRLGDMPPIYARSIGKVRYITTLWGYSAPDDPKHYERIMDLNDNMITIVDGNNLTCTGKWPPPFRLPYPAQPDSFKNLQEACAVSLSGGKITMNAGAYCSREDYVEHSFADVGFSDEMTPLKEWTWDWHYYTEVPVFPPPPVLLREYCYDNCRCTDLRYKRRKNRLMTTIWPYLKADVGNMEELPWMRPKEGQPSGSGGTSNGPQPLSKQIQLYLKLQQVREKPNRPITFVPASVCAPTCSEDGRCRSIPDKKCRYRARCAVDPSSLKQMVVGTLANVVTYYGTPQCIREHHGLPSRLSGRIVEEEQMIMNSWPCACNASYVSHVCCDSESGEIWEPPDLMLGKLK